jgi:hypothetical protein
MALALNKMALQFLAENLLNGDGRSWENILVLIGIAQKSQFWSFP